MAEAEAVCDRVAVMVSGSLRWVGPQARSERGPLPDTVVYAWGWAGRLPWSQGPASPVGFPSLPLPADPPLTSRCVGSIQHLKSKFGRGYLLEMKLKSLARLEALHGEVLRIFPQAARQERSMWARSVLSWSLLCFSVMARYKSFIFSFLKKKNIKTVWES